MRLPMVSESDISPSCSFFEGEWEHPGRNLAPFPQENRKTPRFLLRGLLRVEAEAERIERFQDQVAAAEIVVGPVERPARGLDADGCDWLGREVQRLLAHHLELGSLGFAPVEKVEHDL